MNSRHCSRLMILGGVSFSASSDAGGTGVGQMLGLADVELNILRFSALADDHTGINLGTRAR